MAENAPDVKFATPPASAMTILAHPDDAEFGSGGTLATWAQAGTEITMLILTDGSKGSPDRTMTPTQLLQMRQEEQARAAKALGVAHVVHLGYEDGVLQPTIALRRDIARVIRQYRPEAIITGDPDARFGGDNYINHPDHRAAAEAALYGIFPAADNHNYFPELLTEGLEPHYVQQLYIQQWDGGSTVVPVSEEAMNAKIAALAEHKSQFDIKDVEGFIRERTAEIGKKHNLPYAETYRLLVLRAPRSAEEDKANAAQTIEATDSVAEEAKEASSVGT